MPTGEERAGEVGEIFGYVIVGGLENGDYFGVHRLYDLAQLAPGRRNVVELAFDELVALLESGVLLQGQGVDRAHEPQLPLQLAGPAGGAAARRQRGALRGAQRLRLAVELPAHRLGQSLQPRLHL